MMQTLWSGTIQFLDIYYGKAENKKTNGNQDACFKDLFKAISQLK
ncbi:MAG: hypothetical protein AB8H12_18755 [Lewinella sp.]